MRLSEITDLKDDIIEYTAVCLVEILCELRRILVNHNKISLENLVIDKDGRVMLTDFSLALYNDGAIFFGEKVEVDRFYCSPEFLIQNVSPFISSVFFNIKFK